MALCALFHSACSVFFNTSLGIFQQFTGLFSDPSICNLHIASLASLRTQNADLLSTMYWQHEYEANKPARDAAAKLKAEADADEASRAAEVPLHTENEWNIRSVVK